MIDFELSERMQDLKARTEAFIREQVIPMEGDPRETAHGLDDALRLELIGKARTAGLLSPHVGVEYGGLGCDMREMAIVFEAAGYSLLGPQALNCNAPDEGNMHLLEVVANEAQKDQWLRPLAGGAIRSCFSMTEPDGAGSDPNMLATTARQDGNHWVINGRKWFITGFEGAKLNIVMALSADRIDKGKGATMFLVDNDDPAIEKVRVQGTMDSSFAGGHCELRFNDLRVTADQVLGEIGEGYKYAQVRLAPARLTHCMRWLGAAQRAHDIACRYAARRHAFGKPLIEHEGVGFMLADNEMDIHLCRLAIWQAAWVIDNGGQARQESSMAKVICSEKQFRIVDRCMQILGGMGITSDTLVERIWREIRPFRIYDGPNEVHRWAIANRVARQMHKQTIKESKGTQAFDLQAFDLASKRDAGR